MQPFYYQHDKCLNKIQRNTLLIILAHDIQFHMMVYDIHLIFIIVVRGLCKKFIQLLLMC